MKKIKTALISVSDKNNLKAILEILSDHQNYVEPLVRADGDIVIPLEPNLKKSRESHRRLAETFRSMMDSDFPKKSKSRAWVE